MWGLDSIVLVMRILTSSPMPSILDDLFHKLRQYTPRREDDKERVLTLIPSRPNDDTIPVLLPLDPAIILLTKRHRQPTPITIELECRNGCRILGELSQSLLGLRVPD